ncbi:hypothetical protein ACFLQQ_00030 [Actinomycetota bacterium]
MKKNKKNIRDDEMWCPECGAPIKKGFFTCANCKFKVRLTEDINKKQTSKKKRSKTSKIASGPAPAPKKSIEKKKDSPEPEKSSRSAQESAAADKDRKELLDDIFKEDAADPENKKSGSRPGWWNYG